MSVALPERNLRKVTIKDWQAEVSTKGGVVVDDSFIEELRKLSENAAIKKLSEYDKSFVIAVVVDQALKSAKDQRVDRLVNEHFRKTLQTFSAKPLDQGSPPAVMYKPPWDPPPTVEIIDEILGKRVLYEKILSDTAKNTIIEV